MKNGRAFIVISLLAVVLVVFTGCDSSSEASGSITDNQSQTNQVSHSTDESSNNSSSDSSSATPENEDKKQISDSPDGTDTSDSTNREDISKEDLSSDDTTVNLKEEYLAKLKDAKKETEAIEAQDTSTYALKKVENDRWDIWDELLNEIYGVLKEQLSPEEMDRLREEQRNWIKFRDERALEASLKYKGGTQEHLEYVAVLANLTEERCFELVEGYMQ
ncbi:lysozyme inhibitor LprI family protein [Virgibacillus senegalensis]|uniref:lysozyme inhibitor LprI family protein n=1 Tax=Virgibacillus senegalensis TaxID=1499679 RepID=UPI00069E97E4|nr:lysozyme inhibitor LprI family protein [Virgibacillus senegalensis]